MKILFVGQLENRGYVSTARGRLEALRHLGHEVVPLDVVPHARWGGPLAGLFHRLQWGPPLIRLQRDVLGQAARLRPDLVWIDKGTWIRARTLRRLREDAFTIHYTPDAAFRANRTRHFSSALPVYDLVVTTKAYEVDEYRRLGARELLFQYQGFDPAVTRPVEASAEERRRFEADVVFVGGYARGREKFLLPIAELGVDLAIWGGQNWREVEELRPFFRGGPVGGREYSLALGCAKIALGLLSPVVPDLSTTRTFEIPACGAFLLAPRTREHQDVFKEDSEAVFFESSDELVEKIRYYLGHDEARARVAEAGRRRCWHSGYRTEDRMREVMVRAEEQMSERR